MEPNLEIRYASRDFEQRPTKLSLSIYQRHIEGLTVRQLAEDYGEPKSNIARIIRNVEVWYREQDERRLAGIRARGG